MKGRRVLEVEEGFRGVEEKGMRESFAGFKERGWVGSGGVFGKGEARKQRRRGSSHHGFFGCCWRKGREGLEILDLEAEKQKPLVKPLTVSVFGKLKLHCKI